MATSTTEPQALKEGVTNLNAHGELQVTRVDNSHLAPLHARCQQTSCSAFAEPVDFSAEITALLNQTCHRGKQLYSSKGPDYYGISVRVRAEEVAQLLTQAHQPALAPPDEHECYVGGNDEEDGVDAGGAFKHQLVALISPQSVQQQKLGLGPLDGEAIIASLVQRPGAQRIIPFVFEDHDAPTAVHEISRVSPFVHALNQVRATASLTSTPCTVMHSPGLGELVGCMHSGADAQTIKLAFKLLSNNAPDGNIYQQKLTLTEPLCSLLLLKDSTGNIFCDRIPNGIVAYRVRSNGTKTLIFLANSDDFTQDSMSDILVCRVQIFKMVYYDRSKTGARITVVVHHSQCGPFGSVALNLNMQQNLHFIEKTFRQHSLQDIGCDTFARFLRDKVQQDRRQRCARRQPPAAVRGGGGGLLLHGRDRCVSAGSLRELNDTR